MTKIQILENEKFIEYADFDNAEIWLLNRSSDEELDERIINIQELTESMLPDSHKFPQLLTYIYERHPDITETDEEGNVMIVEPSFDYEILSDNIENFAIHSYTCDIKKIRNPLLINYGTESESKHC